MQQDSEHSPLDLARLLDDAVGEALEHENPDRFIAWFRDNISDYETEHSDGNLLDAPFVAVLGRSIWNALPLPGNGYRPRPLPTPGRNDPCFCGSGRKYKHCCADSPTLPLHPEHILPTVLDRTPTETLAHHIRAGRVPVDALVQVAGRRLDSGELWNTVNLLEPLFEGGKLRTDERYGQALDVLCDAYIALGHNRKRDVLLERIVENAERSPLRSDAWQRVAVCRLDEGDIDGAWEAFQHAQQDHPDSPGVGLLELQLLMSRGRVEDARERAGFWEKRLRHQGHGNDNRLVGFFAEMTRDPRAVMADMGVKAAGGAGERLIEWLKEVAGRPLPDYDLVELMTAGEAVDATMSLTPPEGHQDLESQWHAVFSLPKPFSVDEEPSGPDDAWDPVLEQTWMDFLTEHPAAFDSLDILDDLVTALVTHPQYGSDWLDHALVEPLLARAQAIIDHALRDRPEARLSWLLPENRPALRSLARRVYLHTRREEEDAAARVGDRVLALNPNDNHGFRNAAVDYRLRRGEDEAALALLERYADRSTPECAYGRVLALYRLDRRDEAQAALCEAMEPMPKVVRHLTADRVKRPQVHAGMVTLGGDDQAWLYRQAMRDVWQATPGALDWLKQAAKRC